MTSYPNDPYSAGDRQNPDEYDERWATYEPPPEPLGYPPPPSYPRPGAHPGAVATYGSLGGPAPYGIEPLTGLPYSPRSKTAAGLLGVFLGGFGIGRFYTGHVGLGIAQLLTTFVTLGFGALWGVIDGIVMLAGRPTDSEGLPLR